MFQTILKLARNMPFYAVKRGRKPGVYGSWPECEDQVKGFKGPRYKKFNTEEAAWEFVNEPDSPKGKYSGSPSKSFSATSPSASDGILMTRAAALPSASSSSSRSGPTSVSSTRLLALKGTIQNLSHTVAQLQQFCTQAEEQVDQISRKRKAPSADADAPETSRPRQSATVHSVNTGGLTTTDDGFVNVYTDGCCHNNGKPGATAGIGVYWGAGHRMYASNTIAASRAAQQAKELGITNLTIHTDSQFTINGITKWIHKWKKNNWTLSSGDSVINKEDFLELDRSIQGLNVKWVYVRGHAGDPGNEAADQLANDGARQ